MKRKGLRIALAVAVGFSWGVFSGAIIPFLGPLFAAQFLISSSRPLPLKAALAMTALIVVAGAFCNSISVLTGHMPPVLLLLLGLIYFICFFLQANGKGGGAIFLVLVVGVMVPLLTILNRDLGNSILSILVQGVVSGLLLMWVAHALIPDRGSPDVEVAAAKAHPRAARYAAANAAILLIALVACLTQDSAGHGGGHPCNGRIAIIATRCGRERSRGFRPRLGQSFRRGGRVRSVRAASSAPHVGVPVSSGSAGGPGVWRSCCP